MGKQKRQRQKYHTSPNKPEQNTLQVESLLDTSNPLNFQPSGNIFEGLNINWNTLSKLPADDTKSVRSFKSVKSQLGQDKVLSKKEKVRLRKEFLLRKIDTVAQLKKDSVTRKKRKNTSIIGDTNPLHDALPSLESLLKSRPVAPLVKPKGVQKAAKRRTNMLEGVQMYRKLMQNETVKKDHLASVSKHIKAFVANTK